MRLFRDEVRRGLTTTGRYISPVPPGKGACTQVALAIHAQFGWTVVVGDFDDGDHFWLHCWNRRPDGWLVDATADQFGQHDVLICAPDDVPDNYIEMGVLAE